MKIRQFIKQYDPPSAMQAWLRTQPDLLTAWRDCEVDSWLFWIARAVGWSADSPQLQRTAAADTND